MKTAGMAHQLEALARLEGKASFALLMEQGTGKSWVLMADAERAYLAGKMDVLLILAPRGVHTNWVLREIPRHMEVATITAAYNGTASLKKPALKRMLRPDNALRILAVNYDALLSAPAREFMLAFIQSARIAAMIVADESQRIKTHDAKRTQYATALARHCRARRILTGTMVTNNPGDVFSQFEFLREGLSGTTSYRAFFSEYAQLVNAQNPTTQSDFAFRARLKDNPRLAFALIVAKDDVTGRPIYRNLDRLSELVGKHSFRVRKEQCLTLPPKIYTTVFFDLEPKQRAAYELMEREARILMEDGSVTPVARLAALIKLQQITSGYVIVPQRDEPMYVSEANPRLDALMEVVEDAEGQAIIWARFIPEIHAIVDRLRAEGHAVVEYHGAVSTADREKAVDDFQAGKARFFVGNAQTGGAGLTLTAANMAIYFSNSHNNEHRLQSEDRCHRIGTVGEHVLYIDIACVDSIDASITQALQQKSDIASQIYADRAIDVRAGVLSDNFSLSEQ